MAAGTSHQARHLARHDTVLQEAAAAARKMASDSLTRIAVPVAEPTVVVDKMQSVRCWHSFVILMVMMVV